MKIKEKSLKKTKKLNKDKQIIGYLDQTYCDKNGPPKHYTKKAIKIYWKTMKKEFIKLQ